MQLSGRYGYVEIPHICIRQNVYYLRRFSVPRVLQRPAGIDGGCQVISGFRRHPGLTVTLGL